MRRKQKTDFYFASFSKAIEFSRQEALMLYDVLQGFQPENLPKVMEEMHKLENSADISKHEMMEKLAQEFITPIERMISPIWLKSWTRLPTTSRTLFYACICLTFSPSGKRPLISLR